ncbi:MAG: hypothetical protein ABGY41_12710, partial [Candidatus Poribacteria bacterium]
EIHVIPDVPADVTEMERRTWVTLGSRLRGHGVEESIPAAEWNAMRAELVGAVEDAAWQQSQ